MSHEENAAQYLWQRDEARAKVQRLERELAEAKMLLKYADDAVRGEYERFVAYATRNAFNGTGEQ